MLDVHDDDYQPDDLQYGLVADLYGNARSLTSRYAGVNTADCRDFDEYGCDDERDNAEEGGDERWDGPEWVEPEVVALRIRVLRLLIILQHQRSGQLTSIQLTTLYLAWVHELGVREIARIFGRSPDSVSQRIRGTHQYGGIMRKVPEFASWWERKHRNRHGKGGGYKKGH